jgi:hypothetical protein
VRGGSRAAERGSALVEVTWLGLVLMVPLVYVVVTLMIVQQAAFGVTSAVRAAGRAFVLSADVTTARQRAYAAARVAMRDQGLELNPDTLVITCRPTPASCLRPGSTVHVSIRLQVGLPLMPTAIGRPAASIGVSASHTEPYGTYREAARR